MHTRYGILFLILVAAVAAAAKFSGSRSVSAQPNEFGDIIISELAWGGTKSGPLGEWIELFNNSDSVISISGWLLYGSSGLVIELTGQIEPQSFFLLERISDSTISNVPSDLVFGGTLDDAGSALILQDDDLNIIDTTNIDGGPWPAGSGAPDFLTMERRGPDLSDEDTNWISSSTIGPGLDADGNPTPGTPKAANASWAASTSSVDIAALIHGVGTAAAGSIWEASLSITNESSLPATAVLITATLPTGFDYLGDDSDFPVTEVGSNVLFWEIGNLDQGERCQFSVQIGIGHELRGLFASTVEAAAAEPDFNPTNNRADIFTNVISDQEALILLDAVLYDGYENNDIDEAVRIINVGSKEEDLNGWQLSDGSTTATFPSGASIQPLESFWVAKNASAFRRQFGFDPAYETDDSNPSVPDLGGSWPGFANVGDEVILLNELDHVSDVLVYEAGNQYQPGWNGDPVVPYVLSGAFAAEGQILFRRRDPISGELVADTDREEDWAQWRNDPVNGRKVQYPGWDLEQFYFSVTDNSPISLKIALAPDNAYETIKQNIDNAAESIYIETLTFRSTALAYDLQEASRRGVEVIVLLEGAPVGGLDEVQKLNCQLLEDAGGQCWFMISDESDDINDRYRFLHAKFMIFDGKQALVSTENLSPNSLPNDDKSDGTFGRRGVVLVINAPEIIERLLDIWAADFDPLHHQDLFRWSISHPLYGAPAPGTVPITTTGGTDYPVHFLEAEIIEGQMDIELHQSPENSLRSDIGLLELLERSGVGDTILIQQLTEQLHWGLSDSSREEDPNPRLEAIIEAARRGAHVRLMLDSHFQSAHDNNDTCTALNALSLIEKLDMRCITANPTGEGIHNKMYLLNINGQGYAYIGSINGTELSHKANREVALQITSNEVYGYLTGMFEYDWPRITLFPILFKEYIGPADHLLISEVLYDPEGNDDKEFIEIVNPTPLDITLEGFTLGDAVNPSDFEDVRRFPESAVLRPGETLVVAAASAAFQEEFGQKPDYEIIDTDSDVPDLADDPDWGDPAAILQLGNIGDEVILRDGMGTIVDAVVYGSGWLNGMLSCPLVIVPGRSLERHPHWRDTDICPEDFRNWTFPSPGYLP